MRSFLSLIATLLILACDAYALELNDKLKIRIIGNHPGNIIVINRGKEDGIQYADHAKITLPNGFIARLVNFKADLDRSYWKVYRIVYPEYLSRVYSYDLHSLKRSEIPENLKILLEEKGPSIVAQNQVTIFDPDFREEKTIVENDLPDDLETDEEFLDSKKNLFYKLTDKEKWKRDTRKYNLSVYASPFTQESTSKLTQHNIGADLQNTHYKNYQIKLGFHTYGIALQDPNTKQEANINRTKLNGRIEYSGFERRTRYFSEVDYFTQKQGSVHSLNPQLRIGPIGLIKELNKSDHISTHEIGYIPFIEKRTSDVINKDTKEVGEDSKLGLRHSARWRLRISKNTFSLENMLMIQPMMKGITFDSKDMDIQNKMIIAYNPTKHFTVEYVNHLINDGRQKELAGLPETNFIHALNLRLNLDL